MKTVSDKVSAKNTLAMHCLCLSHSQYAQKTVQND